MALKPIDAYREGYEKGREDNIAGNLAETMFSMFRDDPGGHYKRGYHDGARGEPFNPPKSNKD